MLKLHAGRENIDKERFIYENIEGETLVIVPDQYTLVAEEQALRYMKTDCLFDVEILSMNRLGLRLLTEQGEEGVNMLDRYGRFMLLAKLVNEHKDDFVIFNKSAGKLTFVNMLSDFISDFKQQNCTAEEVLSIIDDAGSAGSQASSTNSLLSEKLRELSGVILAYEDAIRGRYTDNEDYNARYVSLISKSEYIKGKNIWIYGYDSITPKFSTAILELTVQARSVNLIVNRNDFGLDEQLISMMRRLSAERGIDFALEEIRPEYEAKKSETISRIERCLFGNPSSGSSSHVEGEIANSDFDPVDLRVVKCANPYYEAENAAIYVWHLVRDLGYRMNEIQLIANDEQTMQPIIKRVFEEYGLPLFKDAARKVTDSAPVAFIVNLLWFITQNQQSEYLFALLKTGLAGHGSETLDAERIENLENYARSYHIRGSMWNKGFKYGESELGSVEFAEVDSLREKIIAKVADLKEIAMYRNKPTVAEFVTKFKCHLEEAWHLGEAIERAAIEQEKAGYVEDAQRTVLSYESALHILDQVVEILGEETLDLEKFTDIYTAGLSNIEVGIIPPSLDGLSMGTMIRTRPRPVRSVVILGANEGILPLSPSTAGLFSTDEKEYFKGRGFALGYLDDIKMSEENVAMYRMLTKPSEKLYISWSACDIEGGDAMRSPLIDSLVGLFPRLESDGLIGKDAISMGWGSSDAIVRPEESLRHLMARIKDRNAPSQADSLTEALLHWYQDNDGATLKTMLEAAGDENSPEPLSSGIASKLYTGTSGRLNLSATSIGKYLDCPFKYYIENGLRPREEREFSGDSRSIGDVYHECLMAVAHKVIGDKALIAKLAADDDALAELIGETLDSIVSGYREGLFISTGNEEYRASRIREVCTGAIKAMLKQLEAETLVDASFEESFGHNGRFKPIRFKVGDQEVVVQGKIDRADVLLVGDSDPERIRVIDYKTGSDRLDMWKMRNGYRMQLMIYMISALGKYEPAGLFYLNIKDYLQNADDKSESSVEQFKTQDLSDLYKLSGKYVDEAGVLAAMPPEVLGRKPETYSRITRAEFEEAKSDVLDRIREASEGILTGKIDITPLKAERLACEFCKYLPICKRDRENYRNFARQLPPDPSKGKKKETEEE